MTDPAEILRLPDGRDLGYAVHGDPAAPPVVYCHGWPASRLEAALVGDLPVRLVAIDRPGYGASSPQPGRRLLDWPADVAALADHLGIGRFHVAGISGGAPYALVCATALPRVAGVALVSAVPPLAPPHAPPDQALGPDLVRLRQLGRSAALGWGVLAGARLAIGAGVVDLQRVFDAACPPCDIASLTLARRQQLIGSWREGVRRSVAGALSDAVIYGRPWGFDLATIATPVTIWHGAADTIVPVASLSGYAALRADRRVLPHEGHYSLPLNRAGEILATLLRPAGTVSPHRGKPAA